MTLRQYRGTRRLTVGVLLFALCVVLIARRTQGDIEFVLDSDFRAAQIETWQLFFTTLEPLPRAYPHPYFDGQLVLAGLVSAVLHSIVWLAPSAVSWFPNVESYSLAAAILLNVVSFGAACAVFYATMQRATASLAIATVAALARPRSSRSG